MTTAMAHAFARAKWEIIESWMPQEDERENPKNIFIVINGVKLTLRQIMNGASLPVGSINQGQLIKARSSLVLPLRNYIERDGILYFENPGRPPKVIEHLWYESTDTKVRDIDRELVTVLKWEKDTFTVEAGMITHMRNLLIRLLAEGEDTRAFLQREKVNALTMVARINDVLTQKTEDLSLETDAKNFYESSTHSLGFTEIDHMVVRALSWEWKNRAIYRNHPYACRTWTIVLGLFRLVK